MVRFVLVLVGLPLHALSFLFVLVPTLLILLICSVFSCIEQFYDSVYSNMSVGSNSLRAYRCPPFLTIRLGLARLCNVYTSTT